MPSGRGAGWDDVDPRLELSGFAFGLDGAVSVDEFACRMCREAYTVSCTVSRYHQVGVCMNTDRRAPALGFAVAQAVWAFIFCGAVCLSGVPFMASRGLVQSPGS